MDRFARVSDIILIINYEKLQATRSGTSIDRSARYSILERG